MVFFALYIGGVIVLHRGLRPLNETSGLIRDFLPERKVESALPVKVDTEVSQKVSKWSTDAKPQPEFAVAPDRLV